MRTLILLPLALLGASGLFFACGTVPPSAPHTALAAADASDAAPGSLGVDAPLGTPAHRDAVMSSRYCASCHPAIYAEHRQNTHGRAFFDEEARMATRGFRREDCIRCHTPRPVFETGIGMTPMQRWHDLEEGNTCMSCHGKADYDYASFTGGAECRTAFEPRVGTVEHCATCHRIAGTPDQWSRAERGKLSGRVCMDCHMPKVMRPVAVGQPPRLVRSHVFPASRSDSQLHRAYGYEARIDGNEVVVRITNHGAGHNFPTANRQRSVESLVVVRDAEGKEVSRSRMVCRYPYASELEPHQMTAPQSSQIPSGKTSEHRVPLKVAAGTVECQLYFKLYRPIADSEARLSHCLEDRRLAFDGVTPSSEPVDPSPQVFYPAAPTTLNDFFDPAGLANTARTPHTGPLVVPEGDTPDDIQSLAAMLESHLPEARRRARERLAEVYPASADALVEALARWSNETFNEAKKTFLAIGAPAVPALTRALQHEHLYVRYHARELLARLGFAGDRPAIRAELLRALHMDNPLDRRSAAQALGTFGDAATAADLRPLLADGDPDVVVAAAESLAHLDDRSAVPAMEAALAHARWPETRRDLARSLAILGSGAGVPSLIAELDHPDELQREYAFTTLFDITGLHLGYEAAAPRAERLDAIGRIAAAWAANGADTGVRAPQHVERDARERTRELVDELGGGSDTRPGGDDQAIMAELLRYGHDAVPALVEGLTFPPGFAEKRALVCEALGRIGSKDAAPFLAAALRDPVPAVTEWACWALEGVRDPDTLAQVRAYQNRIPALVGVERGEAAADALLARAARTRLFLGDEDARADLIGLLLSESEPARQLAIGALREKYGDGGDDRRYDPAAERDERIAGWSRWVEWAKTASH